MNKKTVFTVVWMLNEYEGVTRTYRKEFDDLDKAVEFSKELNNLNGGCDEYEVGLFEGKFMSRFGDSFELEENEG